MNPVRAALYTALAADSTLTALLSAPDAIFYQVAPQAAVTPYVVFSKQSGLRTWTFDGPPMQPDVWLIKAIDKSSTANTAEAIDARADTVLNDAVLTITGRTHLYLRRSSDVQYPETTDGETYHHAGGLYALVTDPA